MSEWKPIETAPKDGTDIIACTYGTYDNGNVYYNFAVVHWGDTIGSDGDEYAWIVTHDYMEWSGGPPLTHWMPIQPPPTARPAAE